jgi:hypothetical protein
LLVGSQILKGGVGLENSGNSTTPSSLPLPYRSKPEEKKKPLTDDPTPFNKLIPKSIFSILYQLNNKEN